MSLISLISTTTSDLITLTSDLITLTSDLITLTSDLKMFRLLLSVIFAALLAVSCSKPKEFTVEGTLSDGSTINMRAIYIDNGHLENLVFPTDKGSFTLRGSSADGTIVELLTNDYRVLGRFYAKDGDKIKLKIDPKSPNKISI